MAVSSKNINSIKRQRGNLENANANEVGVKLYMREGEGGSFFLMLRANDKADGHHVTRFVVFTKIEIKSLQKRQKITQ